MNSLFIFRKSDNSLREKRIRTFLIYFLIQFLVQSSLFAQTEIDSSKGTLKLDQIITIPFYQNCSRQDEYMFIMEFIKPVIIPLIEKFDTFGYTLEVHSDCRSSFAYNIQYTNILADSMCARIKRLINDTIDLKCVGVGESKLANDCYCEYGYLQDIRKRIPDSVLLTLRISCKDSITSNYNYVQLEDIKDSNPYVHVVKLCNESQHQENRRYVIRVRLKEDD